MDKLDQFKCDFKYYKSKRPPPDLTNVLDFTNSSTIKNSNIVKRKSVEASVTDTHVESLYGLNPVKEWHVYELVDKPGLVFIVNPFSSLGQRYWPVRCLRDFTQSPQRLNLDRHGYIKSGNNWWEQSAIDRKLRWATLGYHHNWDTKVYSESAHSDFPRDLAKLTRYIINAAGFPDFKAEAAIVNFYYMDSTLSGHTDYSEPNREAPLISLSFGQSAIFMIGGLTRAEKPLAMYIHSGDVVVMSGSSRLNYHGVPRIISAKELPWKVLSTDLDATGLVQNLDDSPSSKRRKLIKGTDLVDVQCSIDVCRDCKEESFWRRFGDFLKTSRINLNVRQVLLPGQTDVSMPVSQDS